MTRNSQLNITAIAGDWGPKSTKVGKVLNVRPNDASAIWVAIEGLALSERNCVHFGHLKITELMQYPTHITFAVPENGFTTHGDKQITSIEAQTGRTIDVGVFKVLPANP